MHNPMHQRCRHWNEERDFCVELKILAPRDRCEGCSMFESRRVGFGDVVERVIDLGTLGKGKVIAEAVSGKDCGCKKRRAALNRMGGAVANALGGGTDGD